MFVIISPAEAAVAVAVAACGDAGRENLLPKVVEGMGSKSPIFSLFEGEIYGERSGVESMPGRSLTSAAARLLPRNLPADFTRRMGVCRRLLREACSSCCSPRSFSSGAAPR